MANDRGDDSDSRETSSPVVPESLSAVVGAAAASAPEEDAATSIMAAYPTPTSLSSSAPPVMQSASAAAAAGGGGPTTLVRLSLRASKLRGGRRRTLVKVRPDTLARVSMAAPDDVASNNYRDVPLGETEVVRKSKSPQWAQTFEVSYEYGAQLIFFVDVLAGGGGGDQQDELLGRAAFDVRDVLGTVNRVKARRLRKGGVIYAHVEQFAPRRSSLVPSPIRAVSFLSLRSPSYSHGHDDDDDNNHNRDDVHRDARIGRSCSTGSNNTGCCDNSTSISGGVLSLRMRAHDLKHDRSVKGRIVPKSISEPDTYFELSRRSYVGDHLSWIVAYRSAPVKESSSPVWDEAELDLDAFYAGGDNDDDDDDDGSENCGDGERFARDCHILVSVHKMKKRKCKEIGSFETTIRALLDAASDCSDADRPATGTDDVPTSGGTSTGTNTPDGREEATTMTTTRGFVLRRAGEHAGRASVVRASLVSLREAMARRELQAGRGGFAVVDAGGEAEEEGGSSDDDDEHDDCVASSCLSSESLRESAVVRSKRAPFTEYVAAGLDIDFCIAIDFTSSNGDPRIPGTLHYSRDGMMNDYEEAIEAIGSTLAKYSSRKEFPVWGFGAKYSGEVRHIFQCGSEDAAKDVGGALDAYRSVFETDLIMSGPTVLTSVIKAAAVRSKKIHLNACRTDMKYAVLLILTDGIVSDFTSTQAMLSSYSERLPLSIVVVGIGRADFFAMDQWNALPVEQRGRFSFVEFRKHQFDVHSLSRTALQRIPHDVVDYFSRSGMVP